jgi:hypothetical protein
MAGGGNQGSLHTYDNQGNRLNDTGWQYNTTKYRLIPKAGQFWTDCQADAGSGISRINVKDYLIDPDKPSVYVNTSCVVGYNRTSPKQNPSADNQPVYYTPTYTPAPAPAKSPAKSPAKKK